MLFCSYFDKIVYLLYNSQSLQFIENSTYSALKLSCSLKQIFVQCKIILRGNTDHQHFENEKQNVDVAPPGKSSADAHEWSCFLAFAFCYFRAFTHYE